MPIRFWQAALAVFLLINTQLLIAAEVIPSSTEQLVPGDRIADYEKRRLADRFIVQRLTERSYFVIVETYNSTVYVGDEGILVIDPLSDGRGAILSEAIATFTELPVTAVVYSHSHLDHISDAQFFVEAAKAADVELQVVASQETLDEIKRLRKPVALPNHVLPPGGGVFSFEDLEVDVTLTEGNRHSIDSSVIHLRGERTVHAVDFFVPGYIPFLRFDFSADLKAFEDAVDYMLSLDWDYFNDGHGNIGAYRDAEYIRQYLDDIKSAIYETFAGIKDFTVYMDPESDKNRFNQVMAVIEGPIADQVIKRMKPRYGHHELFERLVRNHVFYIAVDMNMHGLQWQFPRAEEKPEN